MTTTVYRHYKRLRHYLRSLPLIDSLGVARAYFQYLQIGQPFPDHIEVGKDFQTATSAEARNVFEWELDILEHSAV